MPDREKVIEGLEAMREFFGFGLPSQPPVFEAYQNILTNAIDLLKEQEEKYNKLAEWSEGHIVFCKDCKHHRECDYWIENGNDWFCADGEREDAENH